MKQSEQIKKQIETWLQFSDGEILKMRKSKRDNSIYVYYSNGNSAYVNESLFINNLEFSKYDMFRQLKIGIPKIKRIL